MKDWDIEQVEKVQRRATKQVKSKALSTLATIVAEFGDCRQKRRSQKRSVAEFGDKLLPNSPNSATSRQCGQGLSGLLYEQHLRKQNLSTLHQISTSSWRHDRHFLKESDRRTTRGHSLKLVTQHCKMEIRRAVSQSEWSSRVIRYLNLLCHPLLFRCLNPDWIKCGQISLLVSATTKSSDSNY